MKKVTTGMAKRKNPNTDSHGISASEKVDNKTKIMPQVKRNTVTMLKNAKTKSLTDHLSFNSVM
jgi:hypothetical protein